MTIVLQLRKGVDSYLPAIHMFRATSMNIQIKCGNFGHSQNSFDQFPISSINPRKGNATSFDLCSPRDKIFSHAYRKKGLQVSSECKGILDIWENFITLRNIL